MKSRTHVLQIIAVALLAFATVASPQESRGADSVPAPITIKIDNFSFTPQTITVAPGTQITWANQDDIPHTVVSDDKTTFKSRPLDTDEKFSFTFTKAGTYSYFCSIHPHMTGKVVVQ
jgi:plastocyanin